MARASRRPAADSVNLPLDHADRKDIPLKLTAENLDRQLAAGLLPVYLVSGDEPLLTGEALAAIRARAREQGYEERILVQIEKGTATWDSALAAIRTGSLFASRRLLELRLPGAKPGPGAATLLKLIEAAGEELLLLIASGRLDREAQAAAWVRAVQERGAWLALWPPSGAQFPAWLDRRARAAGIELSSDAVALLADATEGNLLAAAQEIEKLLLRYGRGARLDARQLSESLADQARFEVLQLLDALAAQDAARALRILAGLRAEGDEPLRVLWWLVRALRSRASGPRSLPAGRLVARAARVDRVAKGQAQGNAWDELSLLAVELCGRRSLPLPRFTTAWERART
jgi:DNA polymerase III subunit delta